MTRRHRVLLALPALLLAAGVLAPPGSPAVAAERGQDRPRVGDCHSYTYRASTRESEKSRPVPCTQPHTAVTVAVVGVPEQSLRDAGRAFAQAAKACYRGFRTTLGQDLVTRVFSAYQLSYYLPTQKQRQQGAHWVRCDANLMAGRRLSELPTPLLPALPLPDSVARCLTAAHATTVCSVRHAYRAAGVLKLSGRYPGNDALHAVAIKRCDAIAGTGWWAQWSTRDEWLAGDKWLVCNAKE